jgi:imidazole glycerol-phosphate synthase subunit HisH
VGAAGYNCSLECVARIVVLDYGSGNLRSAERALRRVGADVAVTQDWDAALDADGLVVPGVGAFSACMSGLLAVRGEQIIGRRLAGGRPVLGICVGMQILFDRGVEYSPTQGADEGTDGCGEWPGVVERLRADVLPHMGWNTVRAPGSTQLFAGLDADIRFYFVHSYAVRHWELEAGGAMPAPLVTWAHHGEDFVAAVENGPLSATQFHPEKSGDAGAVLLENWLKSLN